MNELKSISQKSFYQLIAVYALFITISFLGLISRFTLHFEIFALILAIMGFFIIEKNGESMSKKTYLFLLIAGCLLIFLFRTIPYIDSSIPLGYDSGIYQYAIEYGLERNDSWIVTGPTMEPLFLYLMKPLTLIFSSHFILTWLFIIFNILLGLSIFTFTKEYFGKRAGIISLIIFSVSTVQFITFTYMYYRNILGITLMLFALTFLNRPNIRHRILFILFGGIIGALHRPTFFMFGLSYLFYSVLSPLSKNHYNLQKLKTHIINGVIIIAIALLFYVGRFWPAISSIISPVANSFINPGESPGTFISFFQYKFLTLPYLAFALLGFAYLIKNKKFNILFFWTLINGIIVYFQFFFFNRFIINLDIAMIILSGLGFSILIESKRKFGTIILTLMVISAGFLTYNESINATNTGVTEQDIALIKNLSEITEDNSIIMSFSKEYSPWILAYSNRTIIAPGLFDENKWNQAQWSTFWYNSTENNTKELMSSYDLTRPIYLYTGTKSFNNSCFTKFLEENGRKVYEYNC